MFYIISVLFNDEFVPQFNLGYFKTEEQAMKAVIYHNLFGYGIKLIALEEAIEYQKGAFYGKRNPLDP